MREVILHDQIQEFEINRKRRRSDFDMPRAHYHPYYELYYLLSGKCRMFIDHTIYDVEPGDLILITPSRIHRTTNYSSPVNERVAISFKESYLFQLKQFCGQEEVRALFARPRISVPMARRAAIEELIWQIELENGQEGHFAEFLKRNHLYELLINAGYTGREDALPRAVCRDETQQAIEEAAEYIFHHYKEPLTLEGMAHIAHMSPAYFCRKFKRLTGFGFKEYVSHVRMREAQELLLHTDQSITQIAASCGFSDGNYFGDVFKKIKGVSPKQYRKTPEIF